MVFKRRDRRPLWEIAFRMIYPKGGWGRAGSYVRHRLQRLPDSPERIARGIWAGVFVSFTPLYGTHFLLAALVAKIMRGNILAGLLGTFFGNPLTFVPIAGSALTTGKWLLGQEMAGLRLHSLGHRFAAAWMNLWHNFKAVFTDAEADWTAWSAFYDDIFFPFLIGGILPGIIAATLCYYLCVPLIRAYQKRRAKKRAERRAKRAAGAGNSAPGR